jgi:hypothetical protein
MKPTIKQRWTPLKQVPLPQDTPKRMTVDDELWENNSHYVLVYPHCDKGLAGAGVMDGWVTLSIKRKDRQAECDWRIFMRIKNELVGEDREAFQLFPSMGRVVDTANQYFLFVIPKGFVIAAGQIEQEVSDSERAATIGAVQRPFDSDDPLSLMVDNRPRSALALGFPLPILPEGAMKLLATEKCKLRVSVHPCETQESSDGN